MRVVIYGRVSDDRDGRSESVDQQVAALRAECARRGWAVVREIRDEGISASRYAKRDRPGWQALRRMVRDRECEAVAIWELSRLSRDLSTFAQFRDECEAAGIVWLTPSGVINPASDHDRLGVGVSALLAEQEARSTSCRVSRHMQASAESGRPHGKQTYGYQRVYGSNRELLRVEVVESEAEVLRWLAERLLAGASMRGLIRQLADRGEPTPAQAVAARLGRSATGSGSWEGRTIKRLLTSPVYAGLRVHRGEVIGVGNWPALWGEEQYRRLTAVLRDPARGEARGTELVHWASGVLFCHACHKPLRMLANPKRNYSAYTCVTPQCHAIAISKGPVEECLRDLTVRAARDRRFVRSEATRIAELRAEVGALRARLAEAEAEFAAGHLSAALMGRVEADLTARVAALSAELDRAEVPVVLPSPAALTARWEGMEPAQRRHLCQLALGRVIVHPSNGKRAQPPLERLAFPDLRIAQQGASVMS